MTGEMAPRLQAWMDDPGNIAALARWLAARDISKFESVRGAGDADQDGDAGAGRQRAR